MLAELAEEYSERSPTSPRARTSSSTSSTSKTRRSIMRRLAAVGITTREACGNTVRNVTACPIAGVCRTQAFDVTPYAKATAFFLLGHPDTQDFGRKFKIAFSGCRDEACGLVRLHDIGAIGVVQRRQARLRDSTSAAASAPCRSRRSCSTSSSRGGAAAVVPGDRPRLREVGEKKNRNTARLKFLVNKLGIEEFKRLVAEERAALEPEPRWTAYLQHLPDTDETAAPEAAVPSDQELGRSPSFRSGTTRTYTGSARRATRP